MSRWSAAALVALVCALGSASVRAQPAQVPDPALLVRAPECAHAAYDGIAFTRLLSLELATLGIAVATLSAESTTSAQQLEQAPALAELECGQTAGTLALTLTDLTTRKTLSRTTTIDGLHQTERPRALALAVVALLESSWSELAAMDEDALSPQVRSRLAERLRVRFAAAPVESIAAAPVESGPAEDPIEQSAAGPNYTLEAALRVFPARTTGLLGLRFGWLPRLSPGVRLVLDLEALWGESELADEAGAIGSMHLYWLSAGSGLGFRVGEGPMLEVGPRLQAGYAVADARVERDGAQASDDGGFVFSVLAGATLLLGPARGPWASVGIDLGHTPVGIVFLGGQARLSGMADSTLALRIGAGW